MFVSSATTAATATRGSPLRRLATVAAVTVLAVSGAAAATDVRFAATNLADIVSGQDLWRYDFTVLGGLGDSESVNVLFGPTDYGQLQVISADARLLPSAIDPLPSLPADGILSLFAAGTIAASDPAPAAALQFVWMGSGAPGAQPFEKLNDSFNLVATGVTSPVPEAGTGAMLAAGLAGLAWLGRRNRALVSTDRS